MIDLSLSMVANYNSCIDLITLYLQPDLIMASQFVGFMTILKAGKTISFESNEM